MADNVTYRRRRWVAFLAMLVAPVMTAAIVMLLYFALVRATHVGMNLLGIGLAFFIVLFLGTLLFQWPFHAVAVRRGWVSLRTYLTSGGVIGAAIGAVISTAPTMRSVDGDGAYQTAYHLAPVIMVAILGAANAGFFWLIRCPRRDLSINVARLFE